MQLTFVEDVKRTGVAVRDLHGLSDDVLKELGVILLDGKLSSDLEDSLHIVRNFHVDTVTHVERIKAVLDEVVVRLHESFFITDLDQKRRLVLNELSVIKDRPVYTAGSDRHVRILILVVVVRMNMSDIWSKLVDPVLD